MAITTVFAGTSSVVISDGTSSIMVDGYFSRPSVTQIVSGKMRPDRDRITWALRRLGAEQLDAVFVSHSHIDHVFDAPVVADMTGAALYGSTSTQMVVRGYGLERVPFHQIEDGSAVSVGDFTITAIRALHSDGDRFPGDTTMPVRLPAAVGDFRTGGCYSFHIAHPDGDVFVHPTANFIPGALTGFNADFLYLGAGVAGVQSKEWIEQYWQETVRALGARTVRAIHWDAFWRPLSKSLKPIPWPIDRVGTTMREFRRLASADGGQGIDVALAQLWKVETVPQR